MRDAIARIFSRQAASCRNLGSQFYGRLCELFAQRMRPHGAFTNRIEAWSEASALRDALPLRALGGLHALARKGDPLRDVYPPHAVDDEVLWSALESAMARHDGWLTSFLDSPPQTNEVGRSGILLGCALRLQERYRQPLAWWEIGASAGLNLNFPEYRYQLGVGTWGEGDVEIHTRWEGNPPALQPLHLQERAGCDVAPLDPSADRERLLAYVWPDQYERLARTERALALASRVVERSPASAWVARKLTEPAGESLRVVAHTIVWQYLSQDEREAIDRALVHSSSPVVRIAVEGDGDPESAAITIHHYPNREREPVGRADYHGRWARWF